MWCFKLEFIEIKTSFANSQRTTKEITCKRSPISCCSTASCINVIANNTLEKIILPNQYFDLVLYDFSSSINITSSPWFCFTFIVLKLEVTHKYILEKSETVEFLKNSRVGFNKIKKKHFFYGSSYSRYASSLKTEN